MVKITGPYKPKKGRFEEDFLVLEKEGELWMRWWTSLTSDRVKSDPAFAVTMAYANVQTLASKTSSWVYKQVEGVRHVHALYVLLKKVAYQLFKLGYPVETVYLWLLEAVGEQGYWWEEWMEGVEAKIVVKAITRELIVRHEYTEGQPAAVEKEVKHLAHEEHEEALREDFGLFRVLGEDEFRVKRGRRKGRWRRNNWVRGRAWRVSCLQINIEQWNGKKW
ncbi:hypothetical protein F5148DRAFT_1154322 [Russula earlei]|uniref:Uncharacterized protein n=1 Tax=Russula earlei TaxID=71964 RepID=A0ACC0TRY5_9AGAM|nr:hypothetical protein F5148DRAFT_1154322 [Russula earlei]